MTIAFLIRDDRIKVTRGSGIFRGREGRLAPAASKRAIRKSGGKPPFPTSNVFLRMKLSSGCGLDAAVRPSVVTAAMTHRNIVAPFAAHAN